MPSIRPVGDPFPELESLLPAPHAALVRLMVDAIIARPHFALHGGRPAFMAFGGGGRGKAILGDTVVRHVFGWPGRWQITVPLNVVQAGELAGRRITAGNDQYKFSQPEYVSMPFLCLDELNQPHSAQVRQEVFGLIDSDGTAYREGERLAIRPVIFATYNRDGRSGDELLRAAQWRRVPLAPGPSLRNCVRRPPWVNGSGSPTLGLPG